MKTKHRRLPHRWRKHVRVVTNLIRVEWCGRPRHRVTRLAVVVRFAVEQAEAERAGRGLYEWVYLPDNTIDMRRRSSDAN